MNMVYLIEKTQGDSDLNNNISFFYQSANNADETLPKFVKRIDSQQDFTTAFKQVHRRYLKVKTNIIPTQKSKSGL